MIKIIVILMLNLNSLKLNNQQLKAVTDVDGPMIVLAGAGSGKTKVITYRFLNLTQNNFVLPGQILLLTFSRKASSEMENRILKIHEDLDSNIDLSDLNINTFNSFGNRILKQYSHKLDIINPTLVSNKTIHEIIKSALVYYNKSNTYQINEIENAINNHKVGKNEIPPHFKLFLEFYNQQLKKLNQIDYNDQLLLVLKLFSSFPEIRNRITSKYQYIMIDEFQDTNEIQYKIIKALTQLNKNVCVVGDDDQSIYSWRGASQQNIPSFRKDFPEYKEIKLSINYRCSETIIQAANALIKNNRNRIDKIMVPSNTFGEKIQFFQEPEIKSEAKRIVELIDQMDYDLKDIAVLVRNNIQLVQFSELFKSLNLSFELTGYFSPQKRKELVLLYHYLRVINNQNEDSLKYLLQFHDIDYTEIIKLYESKYAEIQNNQIVESDEHEENTLFKKMGYDVTIKKPQRKSIKKEFIEFSLYRILEDEIIDTSDELKSFFNRLKLLEKNYQNNEIEIIENIIQSNDFQNVFSLNEIIRENQIKSIKKLLSEIISLPEITLDEIIKYLNKKIKTVKPSNKVQLMTIHNSKGLEFDAVFIAGCESGVIPAEKSKNIGEERNLFYVAITRAKKELILSMSKHTYRNRDVVVNMISPFIEEIPSKYINLNNYSSTKTNELFVSEILNEYYY